MVNRGDGACIVVRARENRVLAKAGKEPTELRRWGDGTPQGGVISPLLANIALGVIEERYERWTHHRQ
jgi:retron-type reverse transcriptase